VLLLQHIYILGALLWIHYCITVVEHCCYAVYTWDSQKSAVCFQQDRCSN